MQARGIVSALLKSVFKPRVRVSCAEWVQENIRLSTKTSATAGRYSLFKTPYLKELYDDIDNPRIRRIAACKGAQLGLSQYVSNVLLFNVCNEGFPALGFYPSEAKAQEFTERAFYPSVQLCKAVEPFLTDKAKDITKKNYNFNNCIVRFIGGGNANKFSSNNACIVSVDEADKYESLEAEGEADAIQLAEARVSSYTLDSKLIILSTPTDESSSAIWKEYLRGSQSKYFMPCVHCGESFAFDFFKHFKLPEGYKDAEGNYDFEKVENESYVECPHCKGHIDEQGRRDMIQRGVWKATNPKSYPKEFKSYHISGLFSFHYSIGSMCKRFLISKGDVSLMKDFYNNYLGLPHVQQVATIKREHLDGVIANSPKYNKGELIKRPLAIVLGVDTQDDHFWYSVNAFYENDATAVIDWGRVETFEDLEVIANKQYAILGTEETAGINKAIIDQGGHRTNDVRDFSLKTAGRFIPCYGAPSQNISALPVKKNVISYRGYNLFTFAINKKQFQDTLYISAIKERMIKYYLPQNSDEVLKAQLTSEKLIEKKGEKIWVSTNRNEHIADTQTYLLGFKVLIGGELAEAEQALKQPVLPVEPKRQYELRQGAADYSYNDWN